MSSRFKYILLDADETIFDFKAAEKAALNKTSNDNGLYINSDDRAEYSKINKALWKSLEKGECTREELQYRRFERWLEYLHSDLDAAKFNEQYKLNLANSSILIDGALEFIKELSKYSKLYIVTNGLAIIQHKRFDKSPISEYLEKIYISEEIGFDKPDKRFFDYIFEDLSITDKSRVIIFGDSLTSDMQGGKNASITTCRFNPRWEEPCSELCDYELKSYDEFLDLIKKS